jgi:hypothetical protein
MSFEKYTDRGKTSKVKRLLFILFVIISFTRLNCGLKNMQTDYNINITDIGTYPQPLFEPLRLKVEAYYGDEFRTFDIIQHYQKVGISSVCKVQTGKANIALFNYILSTVFEKVTPVQYLSEGSDHKKDIDLIIEPTVHSYAYPDHINGGYFHIIYAINFYLPEGEQISSWRIKGGGHIPPRFELKYETTAFVKLTQMAMRQVAAQFIADFCNQEEIKKLFNKQCN